MRAKKIILRAKNDFCVQRKCLSFFKFAWLDFVIAYLGYASLGSLYLLYILCQRPGILILSL